MKFDFTGKICAVTGAGAGMGQAISLMLAESGAKAVVMVDLSEKHMAETIDKMKAIGTDYKCVYGDLSQVEFAKKFVEETIETYGTIDVLVNVAGIVQVNSLDTITEADFDRTMAINVKAPMFATQVAARKMVEPVSYTHLPGYFHRQSAPCGAGIRGLCAAGQQPGKCPGGGVPGKGRP